MKTDTTGTTDTTTGVLKAIFWLRQLGRPTLADEMEQPTSSSWLNQVERFFALMTDRIIRRGDFPLRRRVGECYRWLANWNNDPKPFEWKAPANVILDKVRRCRDAIVNS